MTRHFYALDKKAETILRNGHVEIIAFTDITARDNFIADNAGHQHLSKMEAQVMCKDLYGMSLEHAVARGLV